MGGWLRVEFYPAAHFLALVNRRENVRLLSTPASLFDRVFGICPHCFSLVVLSRVGFLGPFTPTYSMVFNIILYSTPRRGYFFSVGFQR